MRRLDVIGAFGYAVAAGIAGTITWCGRQAFKALWNPV